MKDKFLSRIYDIIIIGGGPAGMTAGIYACRAGMETTLIEKAMCGGQTLLADTVENFPGFPEGIKGPDLAEWMHKQARHFGLEVRIADAAGIAQDEKDGKPFSVKLADGKAVLGLSLVIATGARWNKLGIPGESELTGRGISYCATCDGPLFRQKEAVVLGGGDTAIEDALFLAKFAKKVTVVHRRDRLRAAKILQERAQKNSKITFMLNSAAVEIMGEDKVKGVKIKNVVTGKEEILAADGVFIFIGMTANSEIVKGVVSLDEKGYILAGDDMKTSAEGVFACGDVRKKLLRQVVTAAGDGATAAFSAQHYVERLKGTEYPRL